MAFNGQASDRFSALDLPRILSALTLELDLLTFRKAGKTRPFNGADVNEHIVSAVVGLDEAKTLLPIEPFHSTCRHSILQSARARFRATITRTNSTSSMSLEKEPAGTFNKAQRLIEYPQCMPSFGIKQERYDTNPTLGSSS